MGIMKICTSILICLCSMLPVCMGDEDDAITVAVAANMRFAMEEIQGLVEDHLGFPIVCVFDSSGKLATQIINGAPYDVYLAANMQYPEFIVTQGCAVTEPVQYAQGIAVLWTKTECATFEEAQTLLCSAEIQKIAIANPEKAPYGVAAKEMFAFARLQDLIEKKLVYGESIAQVQHFVMSDTVDAAIIAQSQVYALRERGVGSFIPLPVEAYTPLKQGMIGLLHTQETGHIDRVYQFLAFMGSETVKKVLIKYGYKT